MKRFKRIKWGNVGLLVLLMISIGLVLNDAIILVTSLKSLTLFGTITGIIPLMLINIIGEYFLNEIME